MKQYKNIIVVVLTILTTKDILKNVVACKVMEVK